MKRRTLSGLSGGPRPVPPPPYGATKESTEYITYFQELYLEAFRVNFLGVGANLSIGSQPATFADEIKVDRQDWRRYRIAYLNTANAMKKQFGTDDYDLADVLTEAITNKMNGKQESFDPNTFQYARQGLALILTWMRR